MNNFIFIEGVSSAGKTTTTVLLGRRLTSMGYKVNYYIEGDRDNPFDPFCGGYPPEMPCEEFMKAHCEYWKGFIIKESMKDTVLIVEGTLLHRQANDLLRIYAAPDDVILNYIMSLYNIVRHYKPAVFYLSPNNVADSLRRKRECWELPAPTDEQIAFWENRKRVDLYVLNKLPIKQFIIDIVDDWEPAVEQMARYVTEQPEA
ncbi:MAG: hypothetical protein LBS19_11785 [Clostridiales bacterium]|jgi:hypothetical protein|nr:hypothetical protein [Clostridiales bacterium]